MVIKLQRYFNHSGFKSFIFDSYLLTSGADTLNRSEQNGGLYLDGLQFADGRSKRRPLVSVVYGAVQGSLGDSKSLGCDADPAAVQRLLMKKCHSLDISAENLNMIRACATG